MHLASFMFKNALLNADKKTKNDFLSSLKKVIVFIIKEEDLKVSIDDMEYFDNKALYQFTIPTKSKAQRATYTIFFTNFTNCCPTSRCWAFTIFTSS